MKSLICFKIILIALMFSDDAIAQTPDNPWSIGFGVNSYDKMNLTNNVMGINEIETFINNNKIFNMDFNRFSFNEWRHINTFIDYAAYKKIN